MLHKSLFLLLFCLFSNLIFAQKIYKGDGKIVLKNRPVQPFNQIEIDGNVSVEISQSADFPSLKIETDQNLLNTMEIFVIAEKLFVRSRKGVKYDGVPKNLVHINLKNIYSLTSKAHGSIQFLNEIKVDSLEIKLNSEGENTIKVNTPFLRINLENKGLTTLLGDVEEVRINNRSTSKLAAFDLKAQVLKIHNLGLGLVEVFAEKELFIRHAGTHSLSYKGNAIIQELKDEGVGKIIKIDK